MLTGIVIVSYHNEKGTVRFLHEELSKLTDNLRVVVVAVDSDSIHAQFIAKQTGLTLVEDNNISDNGKGWIAFTKENLGYARGNNLGVRILQQTGLDFDYYLFSNDDITITDCKIISRLAKNIQDNRNIGAIGPRVIALDGTDQSPHRKYISPQRMIGWHLLPFMRKGRKRASCINEQLSISDISRQKSKQLDAAKVLASASAIPPEAGTCYWVSGAFMMVRSECFNLAGGFDDRTFLYYEEVILAERFKRQGWTFHYDPSVCVIHYEGGSTDVKPKRRNDIEMQSRLLYYREYMHVSRFVLWLYKTICHP